MQPRAITQVLCTNLMYKSRMAYQRMKRPCCQVSMPLLLHQFSRVMHPALSKKNCTWNGPLSLRKYNSSQHFSLFCWTGKCPKALAHAPSLCLWALYCTSTHPVVGCIWNWRELVCLIYLWTHPQSAYLIWSDFVFQKRLPYFLHWPLQSCRPSCLSCVSLLNPGHSNRI